MSVDTIVTLGENKRYYLVDETIQADKKYFLGTRLLEDDTPTPESEIFEEFTTNGNYYLTPVIEEDKLNSLAAVFLAKFKKLMEEE